MVCFFGHQACGILVPWPGIKPSPPAVEAWRLNHRTAGEVPTLFKKWFRRVVSPSAGCVLHGCVQLARVILFFLHSQVWQCGGSIEVLPCSRVAHLERHHKPYSLDLRIPLKRNALRVAEIWMDEYKDMVYMAWNTPLQVCPGWDRIWEGWRRRKGWWSWWEGEGARVQAWSACCTTSQWIQEMRCWGKEYDFIRQKMAKECLKIAILWGLDVLFFYRSEMEGRMVNKQSKKAINLANIS